MPNLNKKINELLERLSEKYSPLICDIEVESKKKIVKGFVLLKEQKEFLLNDLRKMCIKYIEDIQVLSDRKTVPKFGFGKANKDIVDVYKKPVENLEILSPRGINRLRATQIKKEDFAFRILYKQDNWFLIQMFDDTLGWIQEEITNYELRIMDQTEERQIKPTETKESFLQKYLNVPYLLGGTTEKGIDCSGLSQRFYLEVRGEIIPKYSRDQRQNKYADLIFAKSKDKNISHVGIRYDDKVLHACLREKKVILENIDNFKKYYNIFISDDRANTPNIDVVTSQRYNVIKTII